MDIKRAVFKTIVNSVLFLVMLAGLTSAGFAQVIFQENWETGWGGWGADNAIWEIGVPSSGPSDCHGGYFCAATVLAGNYPKDTDSRLISASVQLPGVVENEEIHLRFWQWFSYATDISGHDEGRVQVSVYDEGIQSWSEWSDIGNFIMNTSPVWSLMDVDLTTYAGNAIKIAFFHVASPRSSLAVSVGWYIDDIEIAKAIPLFTGYFEGGQGDWSADRGLWEIGIPNSGPNACHSGSFCAATVLAGNYPKDTDSRLISPSVQLPSIVGNEGIHLRFWQWFSFASDISGHDEGHVQISVYDEGIQSWSGWLNIGNTISGVYPVWSMVDIDLTSYAGDTLKIAFFHVGNPRSSLAVSTGWYIDDVSITGVPPMKPRSNDLDWDGISDPTVRRPSNNLFFSMLSGNPGSIKIAAWGQSSDLDVPGDYEGDGMFDTAVWRPSEASWEGVWYVRPSNDPDIYRATLWGLSTDKPTPADYDGDGRTDIAVYRPSNGYWYIRPSDLYGFFFTITQWGLPDDIPVPGNYDGDLKDDIAVFRPSTGQWFVIPSSEPGTFTVSQWGSSADIPVPGDYDGDGTTDIAFWNPPTGTWNILPSGSPGVPQVTQWGVSTDKPVLGDYDGDGKTDIAVWRPADGGW